MKLSIQRAPSTPPPQSCRARCRCVWRVSMRRGGRGKRVPQSRCCLPLGPHQLGGTELEHDGGTAPRLMKEPWPWRSSPTIRKRICTSARNRRGSRNGVQNFSVVLFVNLLALGKVLDMSSSIEWNCRDKEKQSLFSITTPN